MSGSATMGLWYRVFGATGAAPAPAAILDHLAGIAAGARGAFDQDAPDWLRGEVAFGDGAPVNLERFLADEEGIRAELNGWAAYLETCDWSPHHGALMERAVQARQLFTVRRPVDHADEALLDRVCVGLCLFLASATDGFYQADGQGFFATDGTLLVQEY